MAPQHVAGARVSLADALLALSEMTISVAEQLLIDRAVQLSEDNKSAAARLLGLVAKRWTARPPAKNVSTRPGLHWRRAERHIQAAAFKEAVPLLRSRAGSGSTGPNRAGSSA